MALPEMNSELRYGDYTPDPCTFKVLVQPVPMWKIRSIARFKRNAFIKKTKVIREKEAVAAIPEARRAQEEEKQAAAAAEHDAEPSQPPDASGAGRSRKRKAGAAPASCEPGSPAVPLVKLLPEPTVGIVRKDSTQWCQTPEEFKHTADLLSANMLICKHQMSALERVRANMVWLLEKATLFETQKNHSEAGFSGTNHHPKKRRRV